MELKYRYYYGGEWNPFKEEAAKAYSLLTEEREVKDPNREIPLEEILPMLDTWPDFLVANSKSVFWQMEKDVCRYSKIREEEIFQVWESAVSEGLSDDWYKQVEEDEASKALCFYLEQQYKQFNPTGMFVSFRLYFSEGGRVVRQNKENECISLTPYEE